MCIWVLDFLETNAKNVQLTIRLCNLNSNLLLLYLLLLCHGYHFFDVFDGKHFKAFQYSFPLHQITEYCNFTKTFTHAYLIKSVNNLHLLNAYYTFLHFYSLFLQLFFNIETPLSFLSSLAVIYFSLLSLFPVFSF